MKYDICNPSSVRGWEPCNSFKRFVVKESAGEEFVEVDNCIDKCAKDIDGIKAALTKLKKTMGDNTGTTTQIDKVVKGLEVKKQELKRKEKELIAACNQVVSYIYKNKGTKSQEAKEVAEVVERIEL